MALKQVYYNFILPKSPEYDLALLEDASLEELADLCVLGEYTWPLLGYYFMAQSGARVGLSFELDPEAINLAHGNVLQSLSMRLDCFCVSMQADYPYFPMAQYHIVQNREQASNNASYIPHWPQPGQLPRDRNRSGVSKVGYQGARKFTELDESRLNADLSKYGISFKIIDAQDWRYLQEIDVLVGIRSFGLKKYRRKPPTKLIDAWHAGIPFIGGWDSAYTQVGSPGREYLRVASYNELLHAIIRLHEDPVLYNNLVDAGRQRSTDYTFAAISQAWLQLLANEVTETYRKWEQQASKYPVFVLRKLQSLILTGLRHGIRMLYFIPGTRNMRESYYDPVR